MPSAPAMPPPNTTASLRSRTRRFGTWVSCSQPPRSSLVQRTCCSPSRLAAFSASSVSPPPFCCGARSRPGQSPRNRFPPELGGCSNRTGRPLRLPVSDHHRQGNKHAFVGSALPTDPCFWPKLGLRAAPAPCPPKRVTSGPPPPLPAGATPSHS